MAFFTHPFQTGKIPENQKLLRACPHLIHLCPYLAPVPWEGTMCQRSSLVAQWVKGLVFSWLWHGFDPCPLSPTGLQAPFFSPSVPFHFYSPEARRLIAKSAVITEEFCCTETIGVPCGVYYNGFKFHFILFGRKSYSQLTFSSPPGASNCSDSYHQ